MYDNFLYTVTPYLNIRVYNKTTGEIITSLASGYGTHPSIIKLATQFQYKWAIQHVNFHHTKRECFDKILVQIKTSGGII